jgi:hypothetical protein
MIVSNTLTSKEKLEFSSQVLPYLTVISDVLFIWIKPPKLKKEKNLLDLESGSTNSSES